MQFDHVQLKTLKKKMLAHPLPTIFPLPLPSYQDFRLFMIMNQNIAIFWYLLLLGNTTIVTLLIQQSRPLM
jgi:hypothetical protein